MFPRTAALVAALFALAALPAAAGANPSIAVDTVSNSNFSKVPASVFHRLALTAGAQDETVRVRSFGSSMEVGGSAQVTEQSSVPAEAAVVCPGRWSQFDRGVVRNQYTSAFRIPAGTSASVTVPLRVSGPLGYDEDLDVEFEIQVGEGKPFTVVSDAPAWTGPMVPEMSLYVVRGANRTTVLTGRADGPNEGRVEVWAYAPGKDKARRLKTVRVDEQGFWSWAGWRPRVGGEWELYTRYRRTATSPRTGATTCGLTVAVPRVPVAAPR